MAAGTLFVLLAAAIPLFGQPPSPVKAGDRAPNLTWTKIVAPATGAGGPQNFFGQTTVLLFLRPVSHNEDAISVWNKLVEEFADKPVNFVWIANEEEDSLAPFLKTHPVRGSMVLDPQEESYKSYGVEGAAAVLIDPKGIIAGFTFLPPDRRQVQAVLDGSAIAVKGDPTEAQKDAFFAGKAVRLDAEPYRVRAPSPPSKPDVPPSDEVRISPSKTEGTISSTGPDHWIQRGFSLREILSMVSNAAPSRIELPESLDDGKRYDFVFVPPREEEEEAIFRSVREAIAKYFHVTITPEIRSVEVYVMTAVKGKTPPAKSEKDSAASMGFATFASREQEFKVPEGTAPTRKQVEEASREAMSTAELTSVTALSSSMDDFRRSLEEGLRRPVVDETNLTGIYDFKIQGEAQTTEQLLGMMRDQLGLLLTPTRRSIEMTVVRSVQ